MLNLRSLTASNGLTTFIIDDLNENTSLKQDTCDAEKNKPQLELLRYKRLYDSKHLDREDTINKNILKPVLKELLIEIHIVKYLTYDDIIENDVNLFNVLKNSFVNWSKFEENFSSLGIDVDFYIMLNKESFGKLSIKRLVATQVTSREVGFIYKFEYKIPDKEEEPETTEGIDIGRRISLEVLKYPFITERKDIAIFDFDVLSNNKFGLTKKEIIELISDEIAGNLNVKYTNRIKEIADSKNEITVKLRNKNSEFVLSTNIHELLTEIGRKTRRGVGNFIVVTSQILSILQNNLRIDEKGYAISIIKPNSYKNDVSPLYGHQYVGKMNSTIDVYVSMFEGDTNDVIIGYKGVNGEADAGISIAPYLIADMRKTVQGKVKIISEIGEISSDNKKDPSYAGNYYAILKVNLI